MMPLYLGVLAGICFYSAWHHAQIALHLRRSSAHLLLAASGVAFGLEALAHMLSFSPDLSVELLSWERKAEVGLSLLGIAPLYWFVGLRAGASRKVIGVFTAAIGVAWVLNLLTGAGLLIEEITALRPILLPTGDVYLHPVGPRSAFGSWVLLSAAFLPLVFLVYSSTLLWRQGRRGESAILVLVLVIPGVPVFLDLLIASPAYLAYPTVETGLTATLVLLSLLESYDVAQTAGLRDDLVRTEALFRRLVQTAPNAIGVFDREGGRLVEVNERALELTGRTQDDLTSMKLDELLAAVFPELDRGRLMGILDGLARGDDPESGRRVEVEVVRPGGGTVPAELHVSLLERRSESLVRLSLTDLTRVRKAQQEKAELEAALRRAEKLETLGTLAGGIAHDLNNMLTPIVGFGELAAETLDGHPAREQVVAVTASADRARSMTRRILTFSRRAESRKQPIPVQAALEQALGFLRAALPARIELVTELDAAQALVLGDEAQLHQLVMSLGTNAAQAMGGEGVLRVTLRRDAGSVVLAVADTGPGIDPKIVDRIFDPFFTTKESGEGSGLGLSVVHGIVYDWDGGIEVHSVPEGGSTFRVRFPVLESRSTTVEQPS